MATITVKAAAVGAPTPCDGPRTKATATFSYARADRSADVRWDLERGRPLAERADISTVSGRAQRGVGRDRAGARDLDVANGVLVSEPSEGSAERRSAGERSEP